MLNYFCCMCHRDIWTFSLFFTCIFWKCFARNRYFQQYDSNYAVDIMVLLLLFVKLGNKGGDEIFFLEREELD